MRKRYAWGGAVLVSSIVIVSGVMLVGNVRGHRKVVPAIPTSSALTTPIPAVTPSAASAAPVTPVPDPLLQLSNASGEWPYFGNNLWQTRLSPDTTLTPTTAGRVKLLYDQVLPDSKGGNEAYPLLENGVLYVTTGEAQVIALEASTGKILWSHAPELHVNPGIPKINRGVGLGKDKVYVLTPDNQLVALRKTDGAEVFKVVVADQNLGYFESMAPLVADGKVFVGSSGGDQGVRGFMAAYNADSGKLLWRFYTVPERGQDWLSTDGAHGGGAVWTTPAYDPAHKRLYFGTGNPSPDFFGDSRQGPNPYTDSIICLDAETGKLIWTRQEVPHDLWDYDVASPPLLFVQGNRLLVGEAGKDGFWYEWEADTGKPVIEPVAFVKQDRKPPTAEGTKVWPGPAGGANYGPSAYSPMTKNVYVAGINGAEVLYAKPQAHKEGEQDLGTGQNPAPASEWTGTITAIQAETGRVSWQLETETPPIGGVTVNAGGVVYFGLSNPEGTFEGVDASTGKQLWKVDTGAPIGSAPIIYQWQGHTYVTVILGGAKSLTSLFPYDGPAHVRTYRLE